MQTNGVEVSGKIFQLNLKAFVCDAPARSFLKCTIGHNGYYACERCTVKGRSVQHRMVFVSASKNMPRTDQEFNNTTYHSNHQKGISPLSSVLAYNCVTQFPLDYMHLVLLGVVKRMLQYLTKGPFCKISANHISAI